MTLATKKPSAKSSTARRKRPLVKQSRRTKATPAQQAARARIVADLAKQGVIPTEEGVQAVLDELGLDRVKPESASGESGRLRGAESLLRAVSAEVGLGRAIEILSAEQSKRRQLVG